MAKPLPPFVAHVAELLAPLKKAQIRSMFGGYGISIDGINFGLIADDVLSFRVDEQTLLAYEVRRLPPFTYPGKKGLMTMASYRRAPEACLDDADTCCDWARSALAAARRKKAPQAASKKTKKKR